MIEYGTIEFKEHYIGDERKIQAVHFGNQLVQMTYELWDAMVDSPGDPFKGLSFMLCSFNMKVIDVNPAEKLIVCANKDVPFWRIAVLFYKIFKIVGLK